MMNSLRTLFMVLVTGFCAHGVAKDVKDTLFSPLGDRIIVNYSIQHNGGQLTLRFQGVQKKLGSKNQEKYKKLDEVAVVMFDRSGNYKDMKFDGMAPDAFMVPSNLNYSRSSDGYFLLQDEPSMQFSVTSGNKAQLSIPLYLAHYEGKRHYKVFAKCGNLQLSSTAGGQRKSGGGQSGGAMMGGNDGGGGYETVSTTTEEVISDEGISPIEEASIRINSVNSMLERATKFPFSEDLTHEVQMLRELRFKVTDPEISSKINQTLEAFETKKQALEEKADAAAGAAAAEQAAAAQAQQARADSIQAAQAQQSSKDKKDMMLLIGGIAGLGGLLMVGKQVFQSIKQSKQQKQMMDSITKAQQASQQMMNGLGGNNPFGQVNQMANQAKQAMGEMRQAEQNAKHLSKEAEAAKQRLMQLRQGKGAADATETATGIATGATSATGAAAPAKHLSKEAEAARQRLIQLRQAKAAGTAGTGTNQNGITITPRKQSLNDVIPAKYKRWRKPGQDNNDKKS